MMPKTPYRVRAASRALSPLAARSALLLSLGLASAWSGCGADDAEPSRPSARAFSGGNPARGGNGGNAGAGAAHGAGKGGAPAQSGGEAGTPSATTGGTCGATGCAGEAAAGGTEPSADAGDGGEPTSAGASGADSAGGAASSGAAGGSGGASHGEAGSAGTAGFGGTTGGGPTQPQSVNGCESFLDASDASAPRTIDWGVTIASNPARCLHVALGQTVTWFGSFDSHPIQPNAGTQPTPITGDVASGATEYGVTFPAPGVYGYECGLHATMRGAIEVY